MRPTLALLCICLHLSTGSSSSDDRRWLASLVDLVELDYQDQCDQRASAAWEELLGSDKGLSLKLERDKAYGILASKQKTDIETAFPATSLSPDDEVLRRRVRLLLQPGDTLLGTEQWIRLVSFADNALHRIRFATDYDCGTNINCTLRELHNSVSRAQDEESAKRIKLSWETHLPSLSEYVNNILPLARNASKENHYNTVEEYWDSLAEYEGATLKAREIWDHIQPLYTKLHKYVSLKLKGADAVGNPLAVTSLKSLSGEDWSNLIEILLPQHPDIYQKLYANLQLKDIGGINAFTTADKLLTRLNIGDIGSEILQASVFNSSCPPVIVDWCQPNKLKFASCKDVSVANYMDAHEAAGKIRYKMTAALHSNNTYILREAPRFSATYEAIPGFISLLSLNPHTLDRAGLYPVSRFMYNSNHHRLVLQLIIALRDLPKLNYYIAVDEWRLNVLMGKIPLAKVASSWSEFRKNISMIESSNTDLLGDPYVLLNKPHVGNFLGIILKYQIYQSYAEELMSDEGDLTEHVAINNARLIDTMMQGYSEPWPVLVSDLLAKRENGLEYTGLTDYFRLLDEYLDNQLDPTSEVAIEDYVEPPEESPVENEIPDEVEDKKEVEITHDNIHDNMINTDEESNFKFETSTVGVLEIKNPVAPRDQDKEEIKEASYNIYWWIGIAIALTIVIVLVAIIARKRHNHRKQLERQRQNSSP